MYVWSYIQTISDDDYEASEDDSLDGADGKQGLANPYFIQLNEEECLEKRKEKVPNPMYLFFVRTCVIHACQSYYSSD